MPPDAIVSMCISRGGRWSLTSLKVDLNRGLSVCILYVVVDGASLAIDIISMVSRARPSIYGGLARKTKMEPDEPGPSRATLRPTTKAILLRTYTTK